MCPLTASRNSRFLNLPFPEPLTVKWTHGTFQDAFIYLHWQWQHWRTALSSCCSPPPRPGLSSWSACPRCSVIVHKHNGKKNRCQPVQIRIQYVCNIGQYTLWRELRVQLLLLWLWCTADNPNQIPCPWGVGKKKEKKINHSTAAS